MSHHHYAYDPSLGPPPNYPAAQPPLHYSAYPQHPNLPPSGYQQAPQAFSTGNYGAQRPYSYHPSVGFTRLPAKFHIWNVVTSGGTSCLELGPQLKGPVAYSAKMFCSSRLKIKEGPYQSGPMPICTIESRHTFSSKSTITFDGFQSNFVETSEFHEGATWPFEVMVNGQSQTWQWRKKKVESSSTLKRIVGSSSASGSKLGGWELVPTLGQGWPVATVEPSGGTTFNEDTALGVFEFHGPAATGQLGDTFTNQDRGFSWITV
ncbi:hypothetical protein NW762_003176 [Fusarium torreyae]|uniref:Uncharacterized protein n=1 Tax=Fusarium torreyae TaxID=1237075 RepID=A0A9W8VHG2_9HYPO|nr:hypothetical protein NW762_003176 [Fusarium torreyae]